jgi:3-deoxy-D-manno-octulosonic-acid transferase
MIFIYRLLFLPLLIVALPRYLGRMFKRGGYMAMMSGRFGLGKNLGPVPQGKRRVWVHAVSVGELQAITPVIEDLVKRPDTEVVLTVTTSTAFALANEKLKAKVLDVRPFPLDFWLFARGAWKRIRPDLLVLMEGEMWPECLHQAAMRKVPVLLANARLSDRSWRRYQKFMPLARPMMLARTSQVLAGNEQDAKRFELLGVKNVVYAGQLKCDTPIEPRLSPEERESLRKSLFPGMRVQTLVLLGSSTWAGEEEFLVNFVKKARNDGQPVRLLLVPRHAERREEVAKIIGAAGFTWHWRSKGGEAPEGTIIHLADTTGELRKLTQAADAAFIGKSLPPHGEGQSPIEAAALGVPSVMGPGMSNFRDIARGLCEAGASTRASDAEDAALRLNELLLDAEKRGNMARNATAWFASQRGARQKTLDAIEKLLGRGQ